MYHTARGALERFIRGGGDIFFLEKKKWSIPDMAKNPCNDMMEKKILISCSLHRSNVNCSLFVDDRGFSHGIQLGTLPKELGFLLGRDFFICQHSILLLLRLESPMSGIADGNSCRFQMPQLTLILISPRGGVVGIVVASVAVPPQYFCRMP